MGRYWVPDASVDLRDIANDFALIKSAGLGGMELLGYYLYGNYPSVVAEGGPSPVDWTTYGWGSEAWRSLNGSLFARFPLADTQDRSSDRSCFASNEGSWSHHGLCSWS